MGKSSLLITLQFGNLVHLVSVVTDVELAPDPVLDWDPCPKNWARCIEACPAGAIGAGQRVDQALCRPVVMERLPRGYVIESCRACRRACLVGKRRTERSSSPLHRQALDDGREDGLQLRCVLASHRPDDP